MKKRSNGFTLVELLIVVAVIGFLAAIAYPSYTAYVIRGKLAEGTSALSDGRIKMEQFFQDNRTYVGGPAPAATANFTYAATNPGLPAGTAVPQSYLITATGIGGASGFVYTIDQTNTKRTTAAPTGWAASTMPATCWISKKGGQC
jgi:type IV pilus assembly protein PilE